MKTLLLVDGNNIAHRCKYKFSLSNAGVDVSVTFGFLRVLLSYIHKFNPMSVMVCWDGGIPPFRRERVPEYKANRTHGADDPDDWDDFLRQMDELIHVSLPLMGIATAQRRYIEADDLLYHAAFMAQPYYDKVIIASNDKDLLQCCKHANTFVLDPSKNELRDASWVEAEYGVGIDSYVPWRAIQGDSSDNIPGVRGIGPATATKLFAEYKYISNIFNAATEHKLGATGERIVEFGWQGIVNNVYVMALAFDRTGARKSVLDAMFGWKPAQRSLLKHYFMRNAFISLMEPRTYNTAAALKQPIFDENVRVPSIYGYRKPVT